jgi:hypothetical protein
MGSLKEEEMIKKILSTFLVVSLFLGLFSSGLAAASLDFTKVINLDLVCPEFKIVKEGKYDKIDLKNPEGSTVVNLNVPNLPMLPVICYRLLLPQNTIGLSMKVDALSTKKFDGTYKFEVAPELIDLPLGDNEASAETYKDPYGKDSSVVSVSKIMQDGNAKFVMVWFNPFSCISMLKLTLILISSKIYFLLLKI